MKKEKEENDFVDTEDDDFNYLNWGNKKVSEYKEIVLRAIEECRVQESKPMQNNMSGMKTKGGMRMEVVDQQKVFSQCVDAFDDLMLRYYDKEVKENMKKIETEKDDKFKLFIKISQEQERNTKIKEIAKVLTSFPDSPIGKYYEEKFNIYLYTSQRMKYRELLLLFARRNDLSMKRTIGLYETGPT
jgi:hypothetical protein